MDIFFNILPETGREIIFDFFPIFKPYINIFSILPKDIISIIFKDFSLRQLVKLEIVSHYFVKTIRGISWPHVVSFGSMEKSNESIGSMLPLMHDFTDTHLKIQTSYLEHIINNYKFYRYNFERSSVTPKYLFKLEQNGCKWIRISRCLYITIDDIYYLKNCDFICLSGSSKFTCSEDNNGTASQPGNSVSNDELVYLGKCKEIYLYNCVKISDDGLSHLINCQILTIEYLPNNNWHKQYSFINEGFRLGKGIDLMNGLHTINLYNCPYPLDIHLIHFSKIININITFCHQITDNGIKYLKNCRVLNLCGCTDITGKNLELLEKLHTINLDLCNFVTDENIRSLTKLSSLSVEKCFRITDDSVLYLSNLTTLVLKNCIEITDKSVQKLANIHKLDLSGCTKITDDGVKHLGNVCTLILMNCNITNDCMKYLIKCNKIMVFGCDHVTIQMDNIDRHNHYLCRTKFC